MAAEGAEEEEEDMEVDEMEKIERKPSGTTSRVTPRGKDGGKKGVWADQRDDMEVDEEEEEESGGRTGGVSSVSMTCLRMGWW